MPQLVPAPCYGKDTIHCDHSGLVAELKDLNITHVALGKAHAVVLTNKGQVFTFGINNKGQCGREHLAGITREMSTAVTMVDEDEDADGDTSGLCAPGKHVWTHDKCMVCTSCGECTGYGSNCISMDRPDRNACML